MPPRTSPARIIAVVALFALPFSAACKEGNVDGFDGSIFDETDGAAGGKGNDAAVDNEDAGLSGQDAGVLSMDAGSGVSLPGIQDVPGELAKAVCAGLSACRGEALLSDYLKGQDCVAGRTQRDEDGDLHFLAASVTKGRVEFHAKALQQCTDDLAALGCEVQDHRLPSSCEAALTGLVPLDGACDLDLDCEGSAFCDKGDPATCPGTCVPLQTKALPCLANHECADGLVCFGKSCVPVGVDGDDCQSGQTPCGAGFECHTEGADKVCRALAAVYAGAKDDACLATGTLCSSELVCASTAGSMGVCEARVASGAACKRAQPNQCPTDEYCDAAAAGASGTCVPFPADGEPCLMRSQTCASGHVCVNAECKVSRRLGEPCAAAQECYSGICEQAGSGKICVTALACAL